MADDDESLEMVAVKGFTYATRRLLPNEDFVAKTKLDRKILIAIKKARPKRIPGAVEAPPRRLIAKLDGDGNGKMGGSKSPAASDDLTAARADYFAKFAKRAFNGWDAATIREKIAAA